MEQFYKTILTFAALVIVIFGLYYFSDWFSKTTGYVLGEDEKMNLALCLKSKEAIFYSSDNCPDCERQLEIFGYASNILHIVNCISIDQCPEGGVPAWKIGENTHYGLKSLDELMSISGCGLNQKN